MSNETLLVRCSRHTASVNIDPNGQLSNAEFNLDDTGGDFTS